jgi:hypothetical protein
VTSTDVLLSLASAAGLSHTSAGMAFADLLIDGHRETWPLRSNRFRSWLRQQYYERTWDAPTPSSMTLLTQIHEAPQATPNQAAQSVVVSAPNKTRRGARTATAVRATPRRC